MNHLFNYEIYDAAINTTGHMTNNELMWLMWAAAGKYSILEIGTYVGKSTKALTTTPGKVYTIDLVAHRFDEAMWKWVLDPNNGRKEMIETNLKGEIAAGKVTPLYGDRLSFIPFFKEHSMTFDMIFLDADHEYESVIAELNAFLPLMEKSCLISGHDAGYSGVNRAIQEVFGTNYKTLESIWYVER